MQITHWPSTLMPSSSLILLNAAATSISPSLLRRSASHPDLADFAPGTTSAGSRGAKAGGASGSTAIVSQLRGERAPLLMVPEDRQRSHSFRVHTLFHDAQVNNLEECMELLQAGENVNQAKGVAQLRPLHVAATCGSFEVASQLINAGADINVQYVCTRDRVEIKRNERKKCCRVDDLWVSTEGGGRSITIIFQLNSVA